MGILTTSVGSSSSSTSGYNLLIMDGRTQSDTDAAAFITAASITDPTQQNAIYFLVGALKYYSLWTKMTACYPFVGGNATAHSKDLKAAYNITWSGAPTHNSNGVTGGGSGYGDTGLAPSVMSQNSIHMSVYNRTLTASNGIEIGSNQSTKHCHIGCNWSAGQCYYVANFSTNSQYFGPAQMSGLWTVNRIASAGFSLFITGVKKAYSASASNTPSSLSTYVLARNVDGSAANLSSKNLAFASIGSGLSDTDALNLSSIVQSYQTILGRAV